MISGDTIAAISSAVGPTARVIVRVSGPGAMALVTGLGVTLDPQGATAFRSNLCFRELRVGAWVYVFRAPGSYSGEDLIEFHLPGSPVLARMFLEELLKMGARGAEPGEFTARAYFNGRVDLTEAEGVAATIAAGNERELCAARRLLAGELARRLGPTMELLADTLALVEVGIDFSQEDVTVLSTSDATERIERADQSLRQLLAHSARFERLAHEPWVVLVGRPNAGKSTLLNALAGHERAVVSPAAGTTRDVISAEVTLSRGMVHVTDVAGLDDELDGSTSSEIARQMRSHALKAIETADVLALVRDLTDPRPGLRLTRDPHLVIYTKLDLVADPESRSNRVSALTGAGMSELRRRLDEACFGDLSLGGDLALNARHVRAIDEACAALARAVGAVQRGGEEVLALELREALDCLGAVLGRISPDDVLGRIFGGFCIGK